MISPELRDELQAELSSQTSRASPFYRQVLAGNQKTINAVVSEVESVRAAISSVSSVGFWVCGRFWLFGDMDPAQRNKLLEMIKWRHELVIGLLDHLCGMKVGNDSRWFQCPVWSAVRFDSARD